MNKTGEMEEFAAVVFEFTKRDMAYHKAAGTTGIQFGLYCFRAGRLSRQKQDAELCSAVSSTGDDAGDVFGYLTYAEINDHLETMEELYET